MKHLASRGIILQKKDSFEQDRIIVALTERYGKLRLLAKGVKKITSRRLSKLELFNLCFFQIYNVRADKKLITQCEVEETFVNIKKDLRIITAASYIAEITDKFILENQPADKIFLLLKKSLETLNGGKNSLIIVTSYSIKLLTILGYLSDFRKTLNENQKKLAPLQTLPMEILASKKIPEKIQQELLRKSQKLLSEHIAIETIRSAKFLMPIPICKLE
ncbi:DNA repair protein RecO [Candidatus Peregrinibacteria bacterium]|nr:DNA repair protein RecO [Candidatus Peregrinibacteria bacterium]